MTYLLDTNVCIKLLNNSSQLVVQKLAEQSPENINLCTVVAFELFYGAYRSEKSENNLRKLEQWTIYLSFCVKKSRNLEGINFGRDYKNLEM